VIKLFSVHFGGILVQKYHSICLGIVPGGSFVLGNLKFKKKTIGVKQSLRALEDGKAVQIIIAKDADPKVLVKIKELCKKKQVEIIYTENMKQLGKACGIDVGAASAAILE
jgi:large subunit ribosomal protein L7A